MIRFLLSISSGVASYALGVLILYLVIKRKVKESFILYSFDWSSIANFYYLRKVLHKKSDILPAW